MNTRVTPRWRWAVLVVGLLVVAVGVTLLVTARRLPPSFSATPAPVSPTPAATSPAAPSPAAPTTGVPTSAAPAVAVAFRPASVTLEAFGVQAPVQPVFTAAGVLDPPEDPSVLGWWGAGQLAGADAGTTVVVGHVDGPAGPGALYRLVHARAGDHIVVAASNGQQVTYAVSSLSYHVKGSDLPTSLFAADGPPRLVVISCGGTFDRSDDEYQDNVVVEATPV